MMRCETMDLDEWEFLLSPRHHDHGNELEDGDGGGGKFLLEAPLAAPTISDGKIFLDMDYFICPPSPLSPTPKSTAVKRRLSSPNQLDYDEIGDGPPPSKKKEKEKDIGLGDDVPIQIRAFPTEETIARNNKEIIRRRNHKRPPDLLRGGDHHQDSANAGGDGDPLSRQVFFFNKMLKETHEFVDIKLMDCSTTKSSSSTASSIIPSRNQDQIQIDAAATVAAPFVVDEANDKNAAAAAAAADEIHADNCLKNLNMKGAQEEAEEEKRLKLSMWWRWGFSGIGALCSFGVAATTVCILAFGSHHRSHQKLLHFHQIHHHTSAHDQRMKPADAISGMRGVGIPLISAANVTFGGFCDAL